MSRIWNGVEVHPSSNVLTTASFLHLT